MPKAIGDKTELSALVDTELYNEFVRLCPWYGAGTWFIRTALQTFVEELGAQPELQDSIRVAVVQMLAETRP